MLPSTCQASSRRCHEAGLLFSMSMLPRHLKPQGLSLLWPREFLGHSPCPTCPLRLAYFKMNFLKDYKSFFCIQINPNFMSYWYCTVQNWANQGSRWHLTDAQVEHAREPGYLHRFSGFGNRSWHVREVRKRQRWPGWNLSFRIFKRVCISGLFWFFSEPFYIVSP